MSAIHHPSQYRTTDGQMNLAETRFKTNKRMWLFRQQRATLSTSSPKGFVGPKISTQFKGRPVLEDRDFVGYQTYKS